MVISGTSKQCRKVDIGDYIGEFRRILIVARCCSLFETHHKMRYLLDAKNELRFQVEKKTSNTLLIHNPYTTF